ncbi:helix-turn-helix domain-containing protein, partial [Jeotgalibacillus marinus]
MGLSLQEVAHRSELSITLLRALEEGRLSDVGSPALVRIHLLAYARALEADQFSATGEQESQPALTHPSPSNSPPARNPFSS